MVIPPYLTTGSIPIMGKFIQAPTQVLSFKNAVQFMTDRRNYYENELGEPSDWECSVKLSDGDVLWIKEIGDLFYDTMLESEQNGGCRVTYPMSFDELNEYIVRSRVYEFKCGPFYQGK